MAVKFIIRIIDRDQKIIEEISGHEDVCLQFERQFVQGDIIQIESSEVPIAIQVAVDKTLSQANLWLVEKAMEFPIPLGSSHDAYPPNAFLENEHTITVRKIEEAIWNAYGNLSFNPLDKRGETSYYPHCSATVETRDESVFAARNTIDGRYDNTFHGQWPFTSWGDNEDANAQIMIEFGRKVTVDQAMILLRADFPHDNYWKQATLVFSDTSTEVLHLSKTKDKQNIRFSPRTVEWVKLADLVKSDEESPFPALSQWEIFGHNDGN